MKLEHPVMETVEYKKLYREVKAQYPHEYEYHIHMYCLAQMNMNKQTSNIIKSEVNIDEIQKDNTT